MLATTVVPINKSDNTSISQSDFTCIALFIQKEWSSHKSQIKSLEFALKNTNSLNDASSWFCPDFRCDCYNCLFLSFCVCEFRRGPAGEASEGMGSHEQAGAREAGVDARLACAQTERNQEGSEILFAIAVEQIH